VEAAERRAANAEKGIEAKLEEARVTVRKELEAQVEDLKRRLTKMEKRDERPAVVAAPVVEKAPEKPYVPAARVDVTKLETPVVDELRRFYKRAVNAEKLLALSDQKLELVEDKLEEIQKRYFAVCRELSLVAVNAKKPQEVSDAEATKLAMDMVNASEDAAQRRSSLSGQPRRPRPQAPRQDGAPQEGGKDHEGRGPGRRRRVMARHDRAEGGAAQDNHEAVEKATVVRTADGSAPQAEAPPAAPAKTDAPVSNG
jgi:hypothetical protein